MQPYGRFSGRDFEVQILKYYRQIHKIYIDPKILLTVLIGYDLKSVSSNFSHSYFNECLSFLESYNTKV